MSASFATPAEMATFMGLPTPADTTRFQQYLDAASGLIRRFTGQTLSEVTGDIVTLQPVDRDTLLLPERPVTAVTTVLILGVGFTDYRFTRAGRLIKGTVPTLTEGSSWSNGATVTYTHGYATGTDELSAIKSICMECAIRGIEERQVPTMTNVLSDAVGFSPRVFLTDGEKEQLASLGQVMVG